MKRASARFSTSDPHTPSQRNRPPTTRCIQSVVAMFRRLSVPWPQSSDTPESAPTTPPDQSVALLAGSCPTHCFSAGRPPRPYHRGQCPLTTESLDALTIEMPSIGLQKVCFVARGQITDDAPHIVLQIGVEKLHRPTDTLGRETTQHQYPRIGGQKGLQRMSFAIHRTACRN